MVRRSLLVAVTAWLVVVLLGSTMVWAVISRAGREVVAEDGGQIAAATSPAADPSSAHHTKRAGHGPRHHASARPSSDPTGPGAATDSASGDSSRPHSDHSDDTSPTHSSSAAPQTREGAWSQVGGTITLACTGSTISSWGATPDQGWKASAEKHSSELEVKFTASGENDRQVEVQASCAGGNPHFHSERSGSEDGGSDD